MTAPALSKANESRKRTRTRRLLPWLLVLAALGVSSAGFLFAYRQFRAELDKANTVITDLRHKVEATRSELAQAQTHLLSIETELENARRAADQAKLELGEARLELNEREQQIAKLQAEKQGVASCTDFFDQWATGAPASISAIAGLGREAAAAKDCLNKGDVTTACKHWEVLLVEIGRIGPPVSESRDEIKELMRQNKCQTLTSSPGR